MKLCVTAGNSREPAYLKEITVVNLRVIAVARENAIPHLTNPKKLSAASHRTQRDVTMTSIVATEWTNKVFITCV